ncbi:unnamed protein product (macronuclear) [Paramecium tetraurelia]|uniref:C2 NT-type domain-containing protein n=1 Tax=Paramecium tetraurelia TaxID=5888 RepID=A0CSA7_PARTE|nr:uncharacterized protein GSPATT00009946001 [Paramecium tetraurelia]CAK73674.1 unnamed protein product [Paramecium tetraurelia]|eukprot:XP_001441071.1 hypothetical protein (macronuclear) [Paramecium tetraurelia strain d4-2]
MKGFCYQVTLQISKVELSIKFPCTLQVMWKRGQNKCVTKAKEKSKNIFIVNESLTQEFTIGDNAPKKSFLVVLLNVQGQSKLAGVVNFDINGTMASEGQCVLNLDRSPDSNAKIHFAYQILNLGETDYTESRINESFNQRSLGESFGLDKENQNSKVNSLKISNYDNQLNKELYEKSLKDLDQSKQKISNLQEQIKKFEEEKSVLIEEIKSLKKNNIELRNENEYLEKQNENQKQELQQSKENEYLVNQQKVKLEQQNHEVQNQKLQYQILQNKYQQSMQKLKSLEESNEFNKFNKVERSTNTKVLEIPEFIEQNQTIKQLDEQLTDYKRKHEKLIFEQEFTQNKLNTVEQDLSSLQVQFLSLQKQLEKQKDQCNHLEIENSQLRMQIKEYEEDKVSKERNNKKIQSDHEKQIDNLKEQLQQNQDQFEQMKEKYLLQKEKIEKLNDVINQQNDELTIQSVNFLREIQMIAKKQEQFGIV